MSKKKNKNKKKPLGITDSAESSDIDSEEDDEEGEDEDVEEDSEDDERPTTPVIMEEKVIAVKETLCIEDVMTREK